MIYTLSDKTTSSRKCGEVDAGKSIVEVCPEKNLSDVTIQRWKKQFGHMEVNEAKKLKDLERENTEPKKMLADAMLAKRVLEYAIEKIVSPAHKKKVVEAAVKEGIASTAKPTKPTSSEVDFFCR